MKTTRLLALLMLFDSLSGLAQEKIPPAADPELAALEQEIFDDRLLSYRGMDLDFDGRCDFREKALMLAMSSTTADLDGDGQVDLLELAINRLSGKLSLPAGGARRFFRDYKKRHPGPYQGKELRQALEEEQALISIAGLACLPMEAEGWQDELRAQLAKEEDRNHNGTLEHDELVWRGALDQAQRTIFSNSFDSRLGSTFDDDFDLDGDGHLSQKERDEVFAMLKDDLDLDGDGQVTLEELLLLNNLPSPISMRDISQSPYHYPILFKERFIDFTRQALTIYDRNGDGRWQPREMAIAKRMELDLESYFSVISQPNTPFTPEARADLLRQLLAKRDLNGNGRVDRAEIPSRSFPNRPEFGPDPLDFLIGTRLSRTTPPVPPAVLKSLSLPPFSPLRISQDPRIPAECLADCRKTLLALYDSNHDGKLDIEEAWVGNWLEELLKCLTYSKTPIPLTVKQQQEWIAAMVAKYDENRDGRLSLVEVAKMNEYNWMFLWNADETLKPLDKNGNGWLDPEERKPLEAKILKWYDFNKDGILEPRELRSYCRELEELSQRFQRLPTPEDQAEWARIRPLFDFDQNGEANLSEAISSILFEIGQDKKRTCQELLAWHGFMLKNFDRDQDGRIDRAEVSEFAATAKLWETLAKLRDLPPKPASLPELRRWALENGDANHDGQLSLKELAILVHRQQCYQDKSRRINCDLNKPLFDLQKIDTRHPTMAELTMVEFFNNVRCFLAPSYPEFDKDKNGELSKQEYQALTQHLLKIGDRNGNGRLEVAESYRLLRQNHAQALAAWEKWLADQDKRQEEQNRRQAEQEKRQQEAQWLKKYDLNGNGKLDPEERARAEADAKAGIQAPARDE